MVGDELWNEGRDLCGREALRAGQMVFSIFYDTDLAKGSDGAYVNVKPDLTIGGSTLAMPLTMIYMRPPDPARPLGYLHGSAR